MDVAHISVRLVSLVVFMSLLSHAVAVNINLYQGGSCSTGYFATCSNIGSNVCCKRYATSTALPPYFNCAYFENTATYDLLVGYRSSTPGRGCSSAAVSSLAFSTTTLSANTMRGAAWYECPTVCSNYCASNSGFIAGSSNQSCYCLGFGRKRDVPTGVLPESTSDECVEPDLITIDHKTYDVSAKVESDVKQELWAHFDSGRAIEQDSKFEKWRLSKEELAVRKANLRVNVKRQSPVYSCH